MKCHPGVTISLGRITGIFMHGKTDCSGWKRLLRLRS